MSFNTVCPTDEKACRKNQQYTKYMTTVACLEFVTAAFNALGWFAATLIGAVVGAVFGFHSNNIIARRSAAIHIRGRILAILDMPPIDAYRGFDKEAVDALRGDFFAAVAHLSEQDQEAANERWDALKQVPSQSISDNEALMLRYRKFVRGENVSTPAEAFHDIMRQLDALFAKHSARYLP